MSETKRVLVVDDDESIRELVTMALVDEGYEAVGAANGEEALAALGGFDPDLILLDTRMPIMSGAEFVAAYRRLPVRQVPLVLLTAAPDVEAMLERIPADAYLAKPFDLDDLLAVVETHLEGNGA